MNHYIAYLVAGALASPAVAADAPKAPPELVPSTPWKVDFGEAGCSIERRFKAGDGDVTVRMLRRGANGGVDILLHGSMIPRFGQAGDVQIGFEPQGKQLTIRAIPGKIPDTGQFYLRGFATGFITTAAWTDDQQVRITAGRKLDLSMRWPDTKAAFAVLQTCDEDYLRDQGIDLKALRSQISPPRRIADPPPTATKKRQNRPPHAGRKLGEDKLVGEVVYEAKIDETGAVVGCQSLWVDGVPDASFPCEHIRTVKFAPAVGADGQPAVGYYDDVAHIRVQSFTTMKPI